jgi:prepilin-type N-terminal cleavage/methylation domain-containing protein
MKIQTLLKLLNISRKNNNSSGFTLIELLIAAAISSLIIGVAGWGLVTLMGSKKASDSQSDKQGEINRASDFINDEIRKAKYINEQDTINAIVNSGSTYTLPVSPNAQLTDLNVKNIVLALAIPDTDDIGTDDELVVYYTKSVPQDSTTWRGPMLIYRWGPTLNNNGSYNIVAGNLNYTDEPLIDGIKATDLGDDFDTSKCPNRTPSTGFSGFYACLGGQKFRDNVQTNPYYTTAQLNINGAVKKATDTAYVSSGASDGSTQTASRINDSPDNILSTLTVPSYKPSVALQARFLCRKINGADIDWRVRTTIEIDGFKFAYFEGEPIDNLTNLIKGTAAKQPDYSPTGKTLSDYKLSSNGSTLKVETKDSSSPTGYVEVPNSFKVTVEPYVVRDANGDYINLRADGSTSVVSKPTNEPKFSTDGTNPTRVGDLTPFQQGCDNSKNNLISVNSVDHPNQAVTLANDPTTNQGVPFPPGNAAYNDNVLKGFNGADPTVKVLEDKGYLQQTNQKYETNLEKDEMVFLFEIGHEDTKDSKDRNKMNEGFDLQDKAVVLSW